MYYIQGPRSRDLISGLRALADFLEVHPDLPRPLTVEVAVYPTEADDAAMCTGVDRIAAKLGPSVERSGPRRGLYSAGIRFGPVQYRTVAVLEEARKRFAASLKRDRSATEEGRA